MSSRLAPYRQTILDLHVEQGWNLSEIADAYGVTRERIRQIVTAELGGTLTRDRWREQREKRERELQVAREERKARGFKHNRAAYNYYHCRCDICTAAHRDHMRSLKGQEPPQHGTESAYKNYGCRCDACKEAGAFGNYVQRRRRGQQWPLYAAPNQQPPRHGTESMYSNYGCRCNDCKAASKAARKDRRS